MKNHEKHKTPLGNLYCLRDNVAEIHLPPFTSQSDATAERSFRNWLSDPANKMAATDYDLYHIGNFDPDDAQLNGLDKPALIASGSSI